MAAQIGVLLVHGMGSQGETFAAGFVDGVRRRLARLGLTPDAVEFESGYWADLLAGRERALWDALGRSHRLDWGRLRCFVISALGDAIAYHPTPGTSYSTYHAIHWRIFERLEALRSRLAAERAPLVLVGHSLGSIILSDHVWDEQTGAGFGRDPFTRAESLAGLVTFGSTLPLFTLGLEEIVPIRFPGAGLPPAQRAAAAWLNFFDRDDILGYPLKPICPAYAAVVTRDLEINVGGLLSCWNPASHGGYWASPLLMDHVARLIRGLAAPA